jgi:hydroxymethylbilane synthase
MATTLTIGTRRSKLALAQSELIRGALCTAHPGLVVEFKPIVTKGDQSQTQDVPLPAAGLKGLWTYEIEEMLEQGEVDLAVHSLKDVPTIMRPIFCLGAHPSRASRHDVVVSRSGARLQELPAGSVVGTSSFRRMAQVLRLRPDLEVRVIRGNIDTRLGKVRDAAGAFDAIILAEAGIVRIGLASEITQVLSEEEMLPAGAQGALGVQCLAEQMLKDLFLAQNLEQMLH